MSYESILARIPSEFQGKVIEMDAYLKSLRSLRFKRSVDKAGGKIKYVAPDAGISYAIFTSGAEPFHHFGWYFIFDKEENAWRRKDDRMETVLAEMAKNDPQQAKRVFHALKECTNCRGGKPCAQTPYGFDGEERQTCYGRVHMRMCDGDFNDARAFFEHLDALVGDT